MAIKKRVKYTSKGERHSVSPKVLRLVKATRSSLDRWMDKQKAWAKGSNPWLTIENPNPNETNKRFIRVQAKHYWKVPEKKKELTS